MSERKDLELIADLVPTGSRVLDLGCGNGEMLAWLQKHKGCSGYGIEIADANVHACVQRGVNVIQLNLEEGLALFDDASFDVVLQIDTLQHLRNTERMLKETARVGRIGIVAFPNFAHWRNRLHVLGGRMPVTRALSPSACVRCCAGVAACPVATPRQSCGRQTAPGLLPGSAV